MTHTATADGCALIEEGAVYRFNFTDYDDMPSGAHYEHSGQTVVALNVMRAAKQEERDTVRIRASDGWEGVAFPEELAPLPEAGQ